MIDLIDRQKAIKALCKAGCDSGHCGVSCDDVKAIEDLPSAVVRCKDCKHRWVNEHYGEKGYMKIKAMCSLDTDDPFELGRNAYDDDWFCADGERKDG